MSFCTTSFLFSCAYFRFYFLFFRYLLLLHPVCNAVLCSVFNCRLLCSLQGTLFRSGFVSIEFLWTAKKEKKGDPVVQHRVCFVSPLLALFTLFSKTKNIRELQHEHEKTNNITISILNKNKKSKKKKINLSKLTIEMVG